MTRLRRTIAARLKDAQNTAAMLTTFNEVDMTSVMALRDRLKDEFEKKHGVKLGFMSFVKACTPVWSCRRSTPRLSARPVYKNYYDIGVVGTPYLVPVARDADMLLRRRRS